MVHGAKPHHVYFYCKEGGIYECPGLTVVPRKGETVYIPKTQKEYLVLGVSWTLPDIKEFYRPVRAHVSLEEV